MSSERSLPPDPDWYVARKALGYPVVDGPGMCAGINAEGAQAYLLGDGSLQSFSTRYEMLAVVGEAEKLYQQSQENKVTQTEPIPSPIIMKFSAEIANARKLMKAWSEQALTNYKAEPKKKWEEQKPHLKKDKDFVTAWKRAMKVKSRQDLMNAKIQKDILEQKNNYFKGKEKEAARFEALLDMEAAAQTVFVHQEPSSAPFLFESKVTKQDFAKTFPVMMSSSLEKQGGTISEPIGSAMGTLENLPNYFKSFREHIHEIKPPLERVILTLDSCDHSISIGYDTKNKAWTLIDPIQLPPKKIPEEKLAETILGALDSKKFVFFKTSLLAIKSSDEKANKALHEGVSTWRTSTDAKAVHSVTREAAKKTDACGGSWLNIAVENNEINTVEQLLKLNKDNINQGRKLDGANPLFWSLHYDNRNITRLLLAHGAKFNNPICNIPPIVFAARNGDVETTRLLLQSKADPNQVETQRGVTALISAVMNGHADVARLLLEYNANPDQAAHNNILSPLNMAAANNHPNIIRLLLEYGAKIHLASCDPDLIGRIRAAQNPQQKMGASHPSHRFFTHSVSPPQDDIQTTLESRGITADAKAREKAFKQKLTSNYYERKSDSTEPPTIKNSTFKTLEFDEKKLVYSLPNVKPIEDVPGHLVKDTSCNPPQWYCYNRNDGYCMYEKVNNWKQVEELYKQELKSAPTQKH